MNLGWHLENIWVLPIGLIAIAIVFSLLRKHPDGIGAGAVATEYNSNTHRRRLMHFSELCIFLALILGLIAWANPRYGQELRKEHHTGIAIMNVLDTSESMEALDFGGRQAQLSRMRGAKEILQEFVSKRSHDQQGLIVFGEQVFTLAPLTGDANLLLGFLNQIHTGMAGRTTSLGDALGMAVKRLRDVKMDSRIVILLTDGKSNTGGLTPLEAATLAQEYGIKVYTIGIGTNGTAPFKVQTLFGEKVMMQQVEMDEKTLQQVAAQTGGKYFSANTKFQLSEVYERINQLETTPFETEISVQFTNHYTDFLAAALSLILLGLCYSALFQRRFPA